jgi:hypothetical protein
MLRLRRAGVGEIPDSIDTDIYVTKTEGTGIKGATFQSREAFFVGKAHFTWERFFRTKKCF